MYSTKTQTRLGLCFLPFPSPSSSGNQVLGEHTLPGRWCISSPPQSQPLGFLGVQQEYHLRCAVCLLWGANLWLQLSWQMSTVQDPRKTCLATGSLLMVWWRMPSLAMRLPLAFWLWLPPTCLSAFSRGWASMQLASSPLVFSQSFVSRPGSALG